MDQPERGKVIPIFLEEEMQKAYIDYAMSVIVGRALPDVRDGLKPVHRRILYAMYEAGMGPDKPHKKSARVVGDVLARYHPHGDVAVYDAMVRLAQDFATRYPLIDGHGNFGSMDGDAAAAMRYTEARMSPLAMEMLADIDKKTVDFIPNYDGSLEEPVVLPAKFPNLLVNGSAGIAVGMATNIPPHNLGEVIDALVFLIDQPEAEGRELMQHVKGPDFPTGGIIMGQEGIRAAYQSGRGTIKVRAKTDLENLPGGKTAIVITELPYQVNKAKLVERIAQLVHEKHLEGISDLRDESDRTGMRVVIELKRDAKPRIILNKLYKHTQMEDSFGIILLALVDGQPRVLTLKAMLEHYLEHRRQVVIRRTRFDLEKARERAHIVDGLLIALHHIDEVIATIRRSRTVDDARQALMEKFGLSERQAQAILDMRLQRLAGMEREKLEQEYQDLLATIAHLEELLGNDTLIMNVVKEELLAIKEKYADPRRTRISHQEAGALEVEDLIPEEEVVVTITRRGYIKRLPATTYRSQRRGGKGITALTTREEDFVEHLFVTTTYHYLMFFTNQGRAYRLRVHEIPEANRQAKGTALINLIYLQPGEYVTAVIPVREFTARRYLFMATARGLVKKTPLVEFDTSRRDGIIALGLEEGDQLVGVHLTDGSQEIILCTQKGMAIRFSEEEVRSMGRTAKGVQGITLADEDRVIGMDVVKPRGEVLVVTEQGFGKRTPLEEYRSQSRRGRGVATIARSLKRGQVAAFKVVRPGEGLMIISREGIIIRVKVDDIPRTGRATQGATLMRLGAGDSVVAIAEILAKEEVETQGLGPDEPGSAEPGPHEGPELESELEAISES